MPLDRYEKQIQLIGAAGQERLSRGSIVVVGAGGLGCPALVQLATAGVGDIGIIDGDTIELSNLPRQTLYTDRDIGKSKAQVAKMRLEEVNPHIAATDSPTFLNASNAEELLAPYEIVIDATDQPIPRYEIAKQCALSGKAHIYGAVEGMTAQIAVFNVQGSSYCDLFPDPPSTPCSCSQGGILGMVPSSIGVLQALEAIKLLLGEESPLHSHLLQIDYATYAQKLIALPPPRKKAIGYPLKSLPTITARRLRQLLQSSTPPLLIDVRDRTEPVEGHIGGLWLPLNELERDPPSLPKDRPTVIYCHRGRRSLIAARILREQFPGREIQVLDQSEV